MKIKVRLVAISWALCQAPSTATSCCVGLHGESEDASVALMLRDVWDYANKGSIAKALSFQDRKRGKRRVYVYTSDE